MEIAGAKHSVRNTIDKQSEKKWMLFSVLFSEQW